MLPGRKSFFFGMHYVVPVVVDWPGTVVAVNLGGAVIPSLVSLYLLVRNEVWVQAVPTTACVAVVCHWLARPVPGLGIAVPALAPSLAAGLTAILFSRAHAAPLAYIGGSLGTLIGADLFNLGEIPGLGAPVASIGGAGTFDGIFLTGILAVLIASLTLVRGELRANRNLPSTHPVDEERRVTASARVGWWQIDARLPGAPHAGIAQQRGTMIAQ